VLVCMACNVLECVCVTRRVRKSMLIHLERVGVLVNPFSYCVVPLFVGFIH